MATESIREDDETTNTAPKAPPPPPWETVDLPEAPSDLSAYDQRKLEESRVDTEMRRTASAAQKGGSTIDSAMRGRPRVVVPLDEGTIYAFALSPSIHEERVFVLAPDEQDEVRGYLKDSSDFLHSTREVLGKIDSAYRALMLDRSMTPEKRSLQLEAEASKAFTKAYTARGAALEAITKKIEYTNDLLDKPLEQQAATPRSVELRDTLRKMDPKDRTELIRTAVSAKNPTKGQSELILSVLGTHHLNVGLTEVEQAAHIRMWNERTQPSIQRRLDLLKKSLTMIESLEVKTISSQFEGALRSKFSRASNIRGISDAAQKALNAINGG